MIYAATNGYLAKVAVERVGEYEEKMLVFMDSSAKEILNSIATSHNIVNQTEEELKLQLEKFEETHPDLFSA